jgi:hypothetical protein
MTNAIKVLLQRQSGFLQLESTLYHTLPTDIPKINFQMSNSFKRQS